MREKKTANRGSKRDRTRTWRQRRTERKYNIKPGSQNRGTKRMRRRRLETESKKPKRETETETENKSVKVGKNRTTSSVAAAAHALFHV